MGNTQATATGEAPSRKLIIDEWEIPEAYKNVAVSDEVVDAVANLVPKSPTPVKLIVAPDPLLSEELEKQKSLNNQLKGELDQLVQLQKRPQITWNSESREEMEEKKKAFDDTVHKIRSQYFNQQKENVCTDIENQILRCLTHNKHAVLNCLPLQAELQRCINEHRDNVLHEKIPVQQVQKTEGQVQQQSEQ